MASFGAGVGAAPIAAATTVSNCLELLHACSLWGANGLDDINTLEVVIIRRRI